MLFLFLFGFCCFFFFLGRKTHKGCSPCPRLKEGANEFILTYLKGVVQLGRSCLRAFLYLAMASRTSQEMLPSSVTALPYASEGRSEQIPSELIIILL